MSENNNAEKPVEQRLDDLERFIARRFDEISMEIEATSQLIDMAEEDAGKRFKDMLAVLHAVSFAGDGSTPPNSGQELRAVVELSEKAANTIMDHVDNIKNILDTNETELSSDMQLAKISEDIFEQAQNIMLACEFQDLISQRVTTALENIKSVEKRLSGTLEQMGIEYVPAIDIQEVEDIHHPAKPSETSSQNDIDALFG